MAKKYKPKNVGPKFGFYQTMGFQLFNAMRKFLQFPYSRKSHGLDIVWEQAIKFGFESCQDFLMTTDAHVLLYEDIWKDQHFKTVFVEDEFLAQMVFKAKFQITNEYFKYPFKEEFISISFPKNLKIQNQNIRSCLVGVFNEENYRSKTLEKIQQYLNLLFMPNYIPDGMEQEQFLAIVTNDDQGKHLKIKIPLSEASHFLEDNWLINYCENKNKILSEWDRKTPFSIQEYRYMQLYIRLVIGLFIYISAFPKALKTGFPNGIKEQQIPNYVEAKKTLSLDQSIKIERASPSIHLRTWHFRTYEHPRYQRNPDGSPVVQFINATIVGAKTSDPQTISKDNNQ